MKHQKWIIFSVVLTLLTAVVTATVLAVPSSPSSAGTPLPSPTPVSTVTAPTAEALGSFQSFYGRWQYTQADYDYIAARMTDGYEMLSVAEFNRLLLDWKDEDAFHRGEDSISRLLRTYPEDKPNAGFIYTTVRASYEEISTRHYGGSCTHMAPTHWSNVARVQNEDVFGDKVPVYSAEVNYDIVYRIAEEEKITIGERDKVFLSYNEALQTYLNGKSEAELKNRDTMIVGLTEELARLDKMFSAEAIALTSELNDYYMDDYREWAN